jgi:uncharacterized protein (DUF1501 family)
VSNVSHDQSRRAFLRRSAALSVAASAAPFATNLATIGEAAASVASDYKALVCVFLYGGNDFANTLIPYDSSTYNQYQSLRPSLALPRTSLASTILAPTTALPDGVQYAFAPTLSKLLPLFNSGKMAPVLNVGTLIQPTTKAQYQAGNVPLPPKLFSHNDQAAFWQSATTAEGGTSGWGGRMGDLFEAGNGNATFTCINATGNAVFLSGKSVSEYSIGPNGPIALDGNASDLFGSVTARSILRSTITAPRSHMFESDHARLTDRSLTAHSQVASAFGFAPTISTYFDLHNYLAVQLRMVARLMSVGQELGIKRQVFFVAQDGHDLHSILSSRQPLLLDSLADALNSFYSATVELGISDKVTTFTASDFGRAIVNNDDGADHGWGGTHFVLGGAVKGRQIYGKSPIYANNGPDDVGQGRLLPSISVDQYAATLASWFGVSDAQMATVLPSINNFSTRNIGFL